MEGEVKKFEVEFLFYNEKNIKDAETYCIEYTGETSDDNLYKEAVQGFKAKFPTCKIIKYGKLNYKTDTPVQYDFIKIIVYEKTSFYFETIVDVLIKDDVVKQRGQDIKEIYAVATTYILSLKEEIIKKKKEYDDVKFFVKMKNNDIFLQNLLINNKFKRFNKIKQDYMLKTKEEGMVFFAPKEMF